MFEQASRLKVRFQYKGMISTEELWDVPLKGLDQIYKSLNAELRSQKEDSLLEINNNDTSLLELKIGIVKHIVKTRLNENEARRLDAERKMKKEKLLGILAEKQDEAYRSMSADDLKKLIDSL